MKCKYCNNLIKDGETFCPSCGKKVTKNNNIIAFIIIGILVLILSCACSYYLGKSAGVRDCACLNDNSNNKTEDNNKAYDDDNTNEKFTHAIDVSKIKYEYQGEYKTIEVVKALYKSDNKRLSILCKNTGNNDFDSNVYINFLDASGTRVDRNSTFKKVASNEYFVIDLDNIANDDYTQVSVLFNTKKMPSYYTKVNVDKSELTLMNSSKEIVVGYNNKTNKEISMELANIYYKNNEIIYFDNASILSVAAGNTGTGTFYYTFLPGYKYGEDGTSLYDKTDLHVTYAYNYTEEY